MHDLREQGVNVHILDKEFGIDTLACFESGQWISIQEKYRSNRYLSDRRFRVSESCPDFTQEYKNAVGTDHECDGEWFHLGAQLYFYGWANESNSDFEKWALIDIAKYKLIVESRGGLNQLGQLRYNNFHGRASFYCIPITELRESFVATHNTP